ncbi:MAG TPA: CDP-alcohol phosphatidyltransferase family protein [Gaiellaceae bacterium]|nr:CDP-alcohol phosphatidyltransferase family protein [Gaiellaceae bacterium]
MPSIAELREVAQPRAHLERPGEEHWAGRLYMRRLSPYLTRLLVASPLSANAVTALMLPAGLLAALSLSFPGVLPALGAVLLVQLQLLLDCCDGEVARWRQTFSPKGIYLDQLSHYSTEAALAAALGVRAGGGWDSLGGWTALGLLVAVLILLLKAETHLVGLARARSGKPIRDEAAAAPAADRRRLPLREGFRLLPFFRPFQAVEASLLALAAALADAAAGDLLGSRVLLVSLAAAAGVAVAGHLVAVLASDRLR